jgi:FkbM family methyltransferase
MAVALAVSTIPMMVIVLGLIASTCAEMHLRGDSGVKMNINDTISMSNEETHSPVGVYDSHLILKSLITPRAVHAHVDKDGYLTSMGVDSSYTSFSLDVGFNRGQTTLVWHKAQPHLYVVAIEANAKLVRQFEYGPEFDQIRPHTMVVHAAASTKNGGVVNFNPGLGWKNNVSDTGSIFGFSNPKNEKVRLSYLSAHQTVRNLRLDDFLKHVPPPRNTSFVWDTLKLDVQGADVDALHSVGDYVENFVCVVAEFGIDEYIIPKGFPIDPGPFFKEHKFVLSRDNNKRGNSIWMNPKYFALYKYDPSRFGCANVYDSQVKASDIIATYEKGGLIW